jgi:predicted dehydrogenase
MKKYAICGLSTRAIGHYVLPLTGCRKLPEFGDFSSYGMVCGIQDVDTERVELFLKNMDLDIPVYGGDQFDRMIKETQPDTVVVACSDVHHAEYTIKALQHGLDVITEKPMVVDCRQARQIMEAEEKSSGSVQVAFNFRYAPTHKQLKRMIQDGMVGRVTNVEFTYNLDTYHGSSYFYRWNRYRAMSGGLTITKSCHHFDLINWLIDDQPEEIFAFGALNYYGPKSPFKPYGDTRPSVEEIKEKCPYHRRWNPEGSLPPKDDHVNAFNSAFKLPYKVQYPEPLYIYDEGIDIEDTYSAVVRFKSGASMTYSLNASSPWEGYVLGINGTKGRIELTHYTAPGRCPFPASSDQTITYYPLFGERQIFDVKKVEGGHGGADGAAKMDMFVKETEESKELGIVAGTEAGAYAVAIGEGIWRSIAEKRPIKVSELFEL